MADVGYRLRVEGEAEFNAALKEINNNVKLNKAEIALLTEEYNANGGSVETLAKKSAELDKAVDSQKEKVAAMKAMYEQASKTVDETDPRMVKLATDIAKQETELVKLTAAQKENEAAMKAASSGIAAYDENIGELDRMLAQSQAELAKLDQQMKIQTETAAKSADANGALADTTETAAQKQERLARTAEQTAQKEQLLTQAYDTQKAKTGELQKALDAAEKTYGTSSKEADNYRLALTKAETELDKMEKELGEASQAAKQADEAMNGIGDELPKTTSNAEALGGAFGDIGGKVGGILDQVGVQLPQGLTAAIGQFGAMAGAASAVVSAVAEIVNEMNAARDEAAAYIDDLNTTASVADLPTSIIQEWQYMADLVDVSVDTVIKSMQKLKENMRDAIDEGRGFLQVGESIIPIYDDQTGELRDMNDVFLDVLDGLKGIENYLDRDAAAMEIFGKKSSELNPLLDQSRQNIEAMRQAAHDSGYVTDDAASRILNDWQNVRDQLAKNEEAYKRNTAAYQTAMRNLDSVSASELRQIENNLFASEKAYTNSLRATKGFFNTIYATVLDFGAGAKKLFNSIKDLISGNSYAAGTGSAAEGVALVGERGTEIVKNTRISTRASVAPLAAAIEAATGGRYTAVGENGPELTYMRGGERVYPHGVIPEELKRLGITSAIRGYAAGVMSAPSGAALVGERGTEIVGTGRGAVSGGSSTVQYFDIRIDADRIQELNDIVRIAESEKRLRRMGYSSGR